jgi:putative tricarboxylic transport membrane protein
VKFNDAVSGAVFLALAMFIFGYAQTLPPMPGQRYGAAAFPTVVALGLGGFSALLIWRGWNAARAGAPLVEFARWVRERRTLGTFVLALALILLYVLFSERIGFIPLSLAMLTVLLATQRVPIFRSVLIAVTATLAIQIAFSDLLRVPLPRGILTDLLW